MNPVALKKNTVTNLEIDQLVASIEDAADRVLAQTEPRIYRNLRIDVKKAV